MRLVKVGRFVINLDAKRTPLEETRVIDLRDEAAEELREVLASLAMPWRPPIPGNPTERYRLTDVK